MLSASRRICFELLGGLVHLLGRGRCYNRHACCAECCKRVTKATRRPSARSPGPPEPARVRSIIDGLGRLYPDVDCELDREDAVSAADSPPFLSAQTTDQRVNMVTPALFKKYPTPQAMAKAPAAGGSRSWSSRPASSVRRPRA
jgi:hypothetical protein